MSELMEDNKRKLEPKILIEKAHIDSLLCGIERCTDRLRRLIELQAPMPIISREVAMIQYRALAVLTDYEAFALMDFAYRPDEETK